MQNNGLVTSGATMTEIIPTNTTFLARRGLDHVSIRRRAVSDVAGVMPAVRTPTRDSCSVRRRRADGVINPGYDVAAEIAGDRALPRDDQLSDRQRKVKRQS